MNVARSEAPVAVAAALPRPFFLPAPPGHLGRRFCLFHAPAREQPRGWVVYVGPFAEEMNKSRRMAAMQARALAAAGYGVLQIDLLGCGDSSGDFGDASWDAWIADIGHAVHWLQQQGPPAPLWLWGQRAGALLAVDAAQQLGLRCNFLFWQPSPSGKGVLQQFLRLKLAGGLADGAPKGLMETLRRQLAEGQAVDVAGYRLAPSLANGLSASTLTPPAQHGHLVWLEVSPRVATPAANPAAGVDVPSTGLLPASAGALDRWREAGWTVQALAVVGPAFWQTTEIEDAPNLIDATLVQLEAASASDAEPPPPAVSSATRPMYRPAEPEEDKAPLPLVMSCQGESLIGMLHRPAAGSEPTDLALVVVVGGPQYRVGSHRHFVQLARALAAAGYPVMCFDYRGMGDSTGAQRSFESIDADIGTAIDRLCTELPAARRIVLWGLCDGASAALLYLFNSHDKRVAGLCLLNPWVRSDESLARTHVKHYYLNRLREAAFWRKLLRGQVAWTAAKGLWQNLAKATGAVARSDGEPGDHQASLPYQAKMLQAWTQFRGHSLLLLSGRDYTAKEFLDHTAAQPPWQRAIAAPRVQCENLAAADHTFSGLADAQEVNGLTLAWLKQAVDLGRDAVRAKVSAGLSASSILKP